MFVGVTAEKLVRGLFDGGEGTSGGSEFIKNFDRGEIYLIWENLAEKKFSLGKIFVA